MKKTAHICSLY